MAATAPPPPPPSNLLAVSKIQTLVGADHILVGWTNPDQENITEFNITWFNVADASDKEMMILRAADVRLRTPVADLLKPESRVIYNIMDLTNNTAYRITIAVLYENNNNAVTSSSVSGTTGAGQGIGSDLDLDDQPNTEDNCPSVANSDQTNTDNADDGGDACDPDDDNDEVPDETDAFPKDVCASTDTDNDSKPDSIVPGCTTSTLTEDTDDDDDGFPDVENATTAADNCPLDHNADQANTDGAKDGGDVCDEDDDDDGIDDAEDVDDNNNSLIEIHNLDQLALLRDDLNGDGTDDGNIDEITSVGTEGCPGPDDGGCVGYELTRSLNFNDADSYNTGNVNMDAWTDRSGSGWQPIGSCSARDVCTSWTGIFDGGGYTLANLFISANNTVNGVGLFGALTGGIQNLHLLNANVSGGAGDVGTLAGYGRNARYENLSVTGGSVMSPNAEDAGGLIGDGHSTEIRHVNISGGVVSGDDFVGGMVGGMVGRGRGSEIHYATVSGGVISGSQNVGGLIGGAIPPNIRYAYVSDGVVSGSQDVGGLIGEVTGGTIRYAYVSGGVISGDDNVGGLIGTGASQTDLRYSYAAPGQVASSGTSGGLIGSIFDLVLVNASYWDTETTNRTTSAGNLGEGHSTTDLQSPTEFAGSIYANWGGIWCDPDTGEVMEVDARPAGFLSVWDLGTSSQYPALNCMPGGLSAQGR